MADDLRDDTAPINSEDNATEIGSKDGATETGSKNYVKASDLRADLMTTEFLTSTSAQRNKGATYVLIGLLAFGILATIFAVMWPRINGQLIDSDVIVKIPRVTTSLGSTSNPTKSVTAVFAVETDTADSDTVDKKVISANIKAILAEGDYEMLTGRDSVNYAKWLINEKLPEIMDVSSIKQMYLLDLQAGDINDFFMDEATVNQQNNIPQGLFPNLQFDRP